MKFVIFISASLLTIISCGTSNQKTIDKKSTNNSVRHIEKSAVSKINLLIADTSIIDLPSKQPSKLIDIGEGNPSFVDSSGNPLCKPSQIITFKDFDKDSLINIFNSFLDSTQQNTTTTTCITLYTHVFLLFDNNNKINEQIDFAFDCPMQFNYLHRGVAYNVKDYKSEVIRGFINKLKSFNAFIPVYGPPPPPKN